MLYMYNVRYKTLAGSGLDGVGWLEVNSSNFFPKRTEFDVRASQKIRAPRLYIYIFILSTKKKNISKIYI